MKIGVCIPCWKRLEFTKFCVPLAIQNAGIDAKWYLVDDCSEDGTFEFLLSQMKRLGPHMVSVSVHNENQGIAKTRNMIYKTMLDDDIDIFCNIDNDLLLPPNWLITLAIRLWGSTEFDVISPWFVNDNNITRQIAKMYPINQIAPDDIIEMSVGSTCILYKREIFEKGIFYPDRKANWTYQDSQHHGYITKQGYKIGLYTGVQAWRLEHIVGDDMEKEKLEVRHRLLSKGDMTGFEKNWEHRKRSIPFWINAQSPE